MLLGRGEEQIEIPVKTTMVYTQVKNKPHVVKAAVKLLYGALLVGIVRAIYGIFDGLTVNLPGSVVVFQLTGRVLVIALQSN